MLVLCMCVCISICMCTHRGCHYASIEIAWSQYAGTARQANTRKPENARLHGVLPCAQLTGVTRCALLAICELNCGKGRWCRVQPSVVVHPEVMNIVCTMMVPSNKMKDGENAEPFLPDRIRCLATRFPHESGSVKHVANIRIEYSVSWGADRTWWKIGNL
jgi:hypothetical protein